MKKITQDNLREFKPQYGDYLERIEDFARLVGVEGSADAQDFDAALKKWNASSAIGFTDAELDILRLYFSSAKHNRRYDSDVYIHPDHGGNTAEHPIFMGLAWDEMMRRAGFGPEAFDPASPESLQAARLSQRIHAMAAVHDAGELVDISFSEQRLSGASRKEPDEEALFGPFQLKLAAYALSTGNPDFYADCMQQLKGNALAAKQKYFRMAVRGAMTGDAFVASFGKVIGTSIEEMERRIDESAITPQYREAMETLTGLLHEVEDRKGLSGTMLTLIDRYQGFAHYARYAGRGAKNHGAAMPTQDAEERMLNRLFGDGRSMSFALADSVTVVDEINFAQRYIGPAFAMLENEPEGTRPMAEKVVRIIAAQLLREQIPLLQKGPALIDFTGKDDAAAGIPRNEADRRETFARRFAAQKSMNGQALDGLRQRSKENRPLTALDGIVDTKAVIAVLAKAADAIESGALTPDSKSKFVIPCGAGTTLPEALQVTPQEIRAAVQRYPLEVANDFRHSRFDGEPVRLSTGGGSVGR